MSVLPNQPTAKVWAYVIVSIVVLITMVTMTDAPDSAVSASPADDVVQTKKIYSSEKSRVTLPENRDTYTEMFDSTSTVRTEHFQP